jgi:hypothetical protein
VIPAITGGKEVYGIDRSLAFQDGVVNIGLTVNTASTPPGQWQNSVIVGFQDELAPDIDFASSVFVGNLEFRYSHGEDLGSSVAVGLFGFYAGTTMAGGVSLGIAEVSSNYCVSIGAGSGANSFVRSDRTIAIGNNTFANNDNPDCIVIGAYASIAPYTQKAIALTFHADFQSDLGFIGESADNSILFGVGSIGGLGFVYHECVYNFAVNAVIDDLVDDSICVFGHVGNLDPDENVSSNSFVFGQYSSSVSYSQVVIGVNSSIGSLSPPTLFDGSFESVVLGLNTSIDVNSEDCVILSGANCNIGQSTRKAIILGSFANTGHDSSGSFNWHGFVGVSSADTTVMLGSIGDNSPAAIAIGFTSYVGSNSSCCASIGSNAHIWDSCVSVVAMGQTAVCGQSCTESVVIGHEVVVGGDVSGYGTYEGMSIGSAVSVGDSSQYGIAVGFGLQAGLAGPQNSSNCVLVNLFGRSMAVGTDSLVVDRVNGFGGYFFVHSTNTAIHLFGFNQEAPAPGTARASMIGSWNSVLSPTDNSILLGSYLQVGENGGSGVTYAIAIGTTCSIYDSGHFVVAIGHSVFAGLSGVHVPPNCTESVLLGHSIGVGLNGVGVTRILAVGAFHTEEYTDTDITALGSDIGAYIGSQYEVLLGNQVTSGAGSTYAVIVGYNLQVGQAAPVAYSVLMGSNSTISDGAGSTIAAGFAMSIAANADHSIVLGAGATVTGSTAIAMGEGATAAANQWVVGATIAPTHEFIIRGALGGGGAINTLRAIDNPASGTSGLFVAYNNGATTASKEILAGTLPLPGGSLILYVDP